MRTTTLFALILFLLTLAALKVFAQPQILIIERAPSQGPDTRFRIQFGTNAGVVNSWMDIGTNDTVQLNNGPWGKLFASAVQVVTNPPPYEPITIGPPSNELVFTNRPSAPMRLKIGTNATTSLRIEGTIDGNNWIHLATVNKDNAPVTINSTTKQLLIRSRLVVPPLP